MRGVVFTGDKEIEIRTLPDPHPGPGEVVIAMKASGLCGSDLRHYRAPKADRGDPANLKVAGHEPCGVIAEIGRDVTEVAVGDRVMMHRYVSPKESNSNTPSPYPSGQRQAKSLLSVSPRRRSQKRISTLRGQRPQKIWNCDGKIAKSTKE